MLPPFLHPPDFFTSHRVISIGGFRPQADQLVFPVDQRDVRCSEGFAKVAIRCRFAVWFEVLEIYRSLRLPDRFAGQLVERHDKLMVTSIEMHDEEVLKND